MEVPEKYLKAVKEIAGSMDAGFIRNFNVDTLEVEEAPARVV